MTSWGTVAENKRVCRSTVLLSGNKLWMDSISGAKPWSRSLSASSSTKALRLGALTSLYGSCKISLSLPGVPTRIWQPSIFILRIPSDFREPPTAVCTTTPVCLVTLIASTAICSANSRVGETMIALMSTGALRPRPEASRFSRVGSLLMIFCKTGIRKARVLPVPVRACARLETTYISPL